MRKILTHFTKLSGSEDGKKVLYCIQYEGQAPFYRKECEDMAEAEGRDKAFRMNPHTILNMKVE